MKIDDNYTLENDRHQWILKGTFLKGINKETGKETITIIQTYHPTISSALKKYCDNALKPCESIIKLFEKVNKLNLFIEKESTKLFRRN